MAFEWCFAPIFLVAVACYGLLLRFYMGRMRRSRLEAFRSKHPTVVPPAAPLRALRYTSAGGRHATRREPFFDGFHSFSFIFHSFSTFFRGFS